MHRNLANGLSLLGVLPLGMLLTESGRESLIPLILWNNLMDDLDGMAASRLQIRSRFGAILDNVCDGFSHTLFVMMAAAQVASGMEQHSVMSFGVMAAAAVAAAAVLLRIVSRLDPDRPTGTGSPTNELIRHVLFVLLLSDQGVLPAGPFLVILFPLHAVSMLLPVEMPWLIRKRAQSAGSVLLVNVVLVAAWLAPAVTAVAAAAFAGTWLASLLRALMNVRGRPARGQ